MKVTDVPPLLLHTELVDETIDTEGTTIELTIIVPVTVTCEQLPVVVTV